MLTPSITRAIPIWSSTEYPERTEIKELTFSFLTGVKIKINSMFFFENFLKNVFLRYHWDHTMTVCVRKGPNWRNYALVVWDNNSKNVFEYRNVNRMVIFKCLIIKVKFYDFPLRFNEILSKTSKKLLSKVFCE